NIRGSVIMIALSLYYGFTSTGVDNWCHVGGLISGFFLSLLLYRRKD
ncbi:MAG: rhomboid family intramembrane serine protease, partial [Roseburia sp.]